MDSSVNAIKDFIVEFWQAILFFSYQFTLIVGTLTMGMYVATKEEKLLGNVVKILIVWLVLEGIDACL
ncbi:MAG: hypothetical protein RSD74_02230 [Angelakisella sp.]